MSTQKLHVNVHTSLIHKSQNPENNSDAHQLANTYSARKREKQWYMLHHGQISKALNQVKRTSQKKKTTFCLMTVMWHSGRCKARPVVAGAGHEGRGLMTRWPEKAVLCPRALPYLSYWPVPSADFPCPGESPSAYSPQCSLATDLTSSPALWC